jgi:hypothetical protein
LERAEFMRVPFPAARIRQATLGRAAELGPAAGMREIL